ncbi:hypothetical protein Gpo141_00000653 [Globisporangium polare]
MTRGAKSTTVARGVRRGGRRRHRVLLLWPLLLLGLLLNAVTCVPSVAALDIPWQQYLEVLGFYTGLGYQCTFVENPSQSVRSYLHTHLKAQDRALESVVAAIEAWEFSRTSSKDRSPLVLAITGPTGTGKTEMSNLLAESVFKRRTRLPNSEKHIASGLLVFRGEDFSDNFTNPVTEYHTQIKTRLAEHLHHCSGKAVVVIDEVQKVIPHTLDVLMEALSSRAQFTYYKNGISRKIDTSNVIFVLVSDIGVVEMEHVMIQYEKRSDVPMATLEKVVKSALDAQWKRLNFGKMINQVIPFLPFEQVHIAQIITLKLSQLDENYRGIYWHRLWIEDGIADYMSRLDSMHYEVRSAKVGGKVTSSKIFAKYGARNVETGPIQLLKSKLLRYLRPFNPDAEVRISQDPDSKEISITSCAPEDPLGKKQKDSKAGGDGETEGEEFVSISCLTRWKGKFV